MIVASHRMDNRLYPDVEVTVANDGDVHVNFTILPDTRNLRLSFEELTEIVQFVEKHADVELVRA